MVETPTKAIAKDLEIIAKDLEIVIEKSSQKIQELKNLLEKLKRINSSPSPSVKDIENTLADILEASLYVITILNYLSNEVRDITRYLVLLKRIGERP